MTRTTFYSTLSCAALVVALVASGCGSSSTINPGGTGGSRATGGRTGAGGGAIIIGSGGMPGTDGGTNACMNNAPCTAGFTCAAPCMANGVAGTRACTCGANGQLNCPGGGANCNTGDAGAPPPPADAGFNMCMVNAPCTATFTCEVACMANGNPGMRPCTCGANGRLACPGGAATCNTGIDAGFNMCMNGTPCTAGFTCAAACMVGGMPGTRACTCAANGTLNCPGGGGTCILNDAGVQPDAPGPG